MCMGYVLPLEIARCQGADGGTGVLRLRAAALRFAQDDFSSGGDGEEVKKSHTLRTARFEMRWWRSERVRNSEDDGSPRMTVLRRDQ